MRPNIFAISMFPPSYVPTFPGFTTPTHVHQLGQGFKYKSAEEPNFDSHQPQNQIHLQYVPYHGMPD